MRQSMRSQSRTRLSDWTELNRTVVTIPLPSRTVVSKGGKTVLRSLLGTQGEGWNADGSISGLEGWRVAAPPKTLVYTQGLLPRVVSGAAARRRGEPSSFRTRAQSIGLLGARQLWPAEGGRGRGRDVRAGPRPGSRTVEQPRRRHGGGACARGRGLRAQKATAQRA